MTRSILVLISICCIFLGGCVSSSSDFGRYSTNDYEDHDEDVVTSDNWECTDDCSGHEAGYEWAEDKGITDPDDCGGNSESFIEGCEAYANEQEIEEAEDEEEYEEEDEDYF